MAGHELHNWDFNFVILKKKIYNKVTASHVHTCMSQKLNYFFISGKKKWSRIYYVESQYETRYDIVLFACGWMDLYSVVGCVNNKYQIYWRAGEMGGIFH